MYCAWREHIGTSGCGSSWLYNCAARIQLLGVEFIFFFFFSSRRRHTRYWRDWSSDVCSSDLFDNIEVVDLHGVEAAKTPVDSSVVRTAVETWRDLGHSEVAVYPTIGGSGPTSLIATELGIPTIMTGSVANTASRIHSPNESARLDDYFEATRYFAGFFERFAEDG